MVDMSLADAPSAIALLAVPGQRVTGQTKMGYPET
jgi:hypothetical protein